MLRNLKYFLSITGRLSESELEACVNYFDMGVEGFVKIADIQRKYPQENDIKNFNPK